MSGILSETRTYNSMFQLTQITVPGVLNMQYAYSATQNNGKITSQTDVISGEQVLYTYDSLNRLATATTAANPNVTQWGQSYTYDGFGNLTDQNVINGSAPTMHVAYNAATNRQTGDTADRSGRPTASPSAAAPSTSRSPAPTSTWKLGDGGGNSGVETRGNSGKLGDGGDVPYILRKEKPMRKIWGTSPPSPLNPH